eukprot:8229819-Pyramimonas_sp.AAC.1
MGPWTATGAPKMSPQGPIWFRESPLLSRRGARKGPPRVQIHWHMFRHGSGSFEFRVLAGAPSRS